MKKIVILVLLSLFTINTYAETIVCDTSIHFYSVFEKKVKRLIEEDLLSRVKEKDRLLSCNLAAFEVKEDNASYKVKYIFITEYKDENTVIKKNSNMYDGTAIIKVDFKITRSTEEKI